MIKRSQDKFLLGLVQIKVTDVIAVAEEHTLGPGNRVMLDKVFVDDGCRRVPLLRRGSPLRPHRLIQTSQARYYFATDDPWYLVAPGSGLAILWEAVRDQSLSIPWSCLTCKCIHLVR